MVDCHIPPLGTSTGTEGSGGVDHSPFGEVLSRLEERPLQRLPRVDADLQPLGAVLPVVFVAGENLSLDGIEHGKIRRFKDPRIHAGLVWPALGDLSNQLDDRMRRFLRDGALRLTPAATGIG